MGSKINTKVEIEDDESDDECIDELPLDMDDE
jgi:hypothetical protein